MTDVRTINTQTELDELTSSNRYVLVDFSAVWSPPCKMIEGYFDKLAKKHGIEGRLAFTKVDIDDVPDMAATFDVSDVPTFLVLVDGKPAGSEVQLGVPGRLRGADPTALKRIVGLLGKKLLEEEEIEDVHDDDV